jgi:hypothetical protein
MKRINPQNYIIKGTKFHNQISKAPNFIIKYHKHQISTASMKLSVTKTIEPLSIFLLRRFLPHSYLLFQEIFKIPFL